MSTIQNKFKLLEENFDTVNWQNKLWYLDPTLYEIVNLRKNYESDKATYTREDIETGLKFYKRIAVKMGSLLRSKQIYFEENPGYNLDEARKVVTMAVLHHTARPEEVDLDELNGLQLIRLYLPYFQDKNWGYHGRTLSSSHFSEDGYPVFYAYHYLIRFNGEIITLLDPLKNIGWHAGNWKINCRSIGICLDGDFVDSDIKEPTKEQIQSLKDLLKKTELNKIIPHYQSNQKTSCPGEWFDKYF